MRPYCNPVDVEMRLAWSPAPEGAEGTMHEAACLALAGRPDDARARLLTLSAEDQWKGAGVVFEVGHPAADAGDDVAAGPLMELVVEFWPNHYMALYHAGPRVSRRATGLGQGIIWSVSSRSTRSRMGGGATPTRCSPRSVTSRLRREFAEGH